MITDPNIWYLISFIIFFLLLGRTLWRASTQLLDEKIQHIRQDIEEATHMKKEAEEFLQLAQKKQLEAQEHARKILSLSEREVKRLQQEATQERKDFTANQERQLQERLANLDIIAFKELKESIVYSAIVSAEKVIQKNLDKKLDSALIKDAIKTSESLRSAAAS